MHTQGTEPQSSNPLLRFRRMALSHLVQDESGQDLVEYALIAALIGLAAVTSAHGVAVSVSSAINIVGSGLTSSL
jgi:pilus assembly protein Flp/PilA